MKKIATIAVLALSATSVSGTCAQNWITTAAGIVSTGDTGNANAAVAGDNTWATCATIKGGANSCCLKTEVGTFQTKANALVEELKTAVSKRDQFIIDRRGDVLNVRGSLNSIEASVKKLASQSGSSLDGIEEFTAGITAFTTGFDTLKEGFVTYQKDRVTCFNKLVQAQVAVWCAACSDTTDLPNMGMDTGTSAMTFGTTFTDAIAGACSSYISSAVTQSSILSLYYVSDYLATLASALEKAANGDMTGAAEELSTFFTDMEETKVPSDDLEKTAFSVGTCTATDCAWITSSLFNQGVLSKNLAVAGGSLTDTSASQRLLQEEIRMGRMLPAAYNSDPANEASGITIEFPENPGNVDNDQNSAIRNGAIACAITALAALL